MDGMDMYKDSCYVMLLENLVPRQVCQHLIQARVLTIDEVEIIKALDRRRQCEELLATLHRKGPGAYEEFVKALEKEQAFLACILLRKENEKYRYELMRKEEQLKKKPAELLAAEAKCQVLENQLQEAMNKSQDKKARGKKRGVGQKKLPPLRKSGTMSMKLTGGEQELEEWMKLFAKKKMESFPLTSHSTLADFFNYLSGGLDAQLLRKTTGSLNLTVHCRSLTILERIWDDYCSGHLNKVAEECLATDEVKKETGVDNIKLKTTISEEDYIKSKKFLTELSEKEDLLYEVREREWQLMEAMDEEEKERNAASENEKLMDQLMEEKRRLDQRITSNVQLQKGSYRRDEDSSQTIKKLKEDNERLAGERKKLEEEMTKYRSRVSRVFLPSGKDFSSSPGVLCALKRDTSARLVAKRSSDGPGEASDIFDHSKGKTSGTEEKKHQWWCIDLGKNYLLVITHYALRHGKSNGESYLKEWQLQGSVDGITWKELETNHKREHPSDPPQFRDPFPYYTGTWSVKGEVGAFRYFRILQTGKNSSGKYGIYLSGFELYGVLFKV